MIFSPFKVLDDILSSGWWKIYLLLGFIPCFSPKVFLFSLPGILLLGTASGSKAMHQYDTYYPIILMCLALFGCIEFMKIYGEKSKKNKIFCFFVLLIFPLHHASSIRYNIPNFKAYKEIQASRIELDKYSDYSLCVQASLIPYLGYDYRIENLTKGCIARKNTIFVLSKNTKPYPFSKIEIEKIIAESRSLNAKPNNWISLHVSPKTADYLKMN